MNWENIGITTKKTFGSAVAAWLHALGFAGHFGRT